MNSYKYWVLGNFKICTRIIRSSLFLSEEERVVMLFILDRTIGWHKVWATISRSEFLNGVSRRRRGRRVIVGGGTHLTPEKLDDALNSLLAQNAIEKEDFGQRVDYKINEDWCHPNLRELGMWELDESNYDYGEDTGGGKRLRPTE